MPETVNVGVFFRQVRGPDKPLVPSSLTTRRLLVSCQCPLLEARSSEQPRGKISRSEAPPLSHGSSSEREKQGRQPSRVLASELLPVSTRPTNYIVYSILVNPQSEEKYEEGFRIADVAAGVPSPGSRPRSENRTGCRPACGKPVEESRSELWRHLKIQKATT